MIDIYPPDLSGPGLAAAVEGLVAPLRETGTEVSVEVAALPPMSPDAAVAVYRVARETLVNVAKHAHATRVRVELGPTDLGGAPGVRLAVLDDGVGVADLPRRDKDGAHLGVHILADRVADLGGRFTLGPGLVTATGSGTAAVAVVLAQPVA